MNLTEHKGYKLVQDNKGILYVSLQPLIIELQKQDDCLEKQIVLDYLYALIEQYVKGHEAESKDS